MKQTVKILVAMAINAVASTPTMAHGIRELNYVSAGVLRSLLAHEEIYGAEVSGGKTYLLGAMGGTFKGIAGNYSVGGFIALFGLVAESGLQYRHEEERFAPYGTLGFSLGFFEISSTRTFERDQQGDIQIGLKIPYVWD